MLEVGAETLDVMQSLRGVCDGFLTAQKESY
jgi:hypothetical protein